MPARRRTTSGAAPGYGSAAGSTRRWEPTTTSAPPTASTWTGTWAATACGWASTSSRTSRPGTATYSGGVYYRYYLNGDRYRGPPPAETELVRVRHETDVGTYDASSHAAYVQDCWAVTPRLTVNSACAGRGTRTATSWVDVHPGRRPVRAPPGRGLGRPRRRALQALRQLRRYHLPMAVEAPMFLGVLRTSRTTRGTSSRGDQPRRQPRGSRGRGLLPGPPRRSWPPTPGRPTTRELRAHVPARAHPRLRAAGRSDWSLGVPWSGPALSPGHRGHPHRQGDVGDLRRAVLRPGDLDTRASCAHDYRLTNPGSDFRAGTTWTATASSIRSSCPPR